MSFARAMSRSASLLVSTYQANKLLVCRAAGAGLSMLVRTFDRPMGLAIDGRIPKLIENLAIVKPTMMAAAPQRKARKRSAPMPMASERPMADQSE